MSRGDLLPSCIMLTTATSQSPPPRDEVHVNEEVKMAVNFCLERFQSSEEREVDFPSCFSGTERAYIQRVAQSMGFLSKSKGKGLHRFLTIWKKDGSAPSIMPLIISQKSLRFINSLLQKFPISHKGRTDVQPTDKSGICGPAHRYSSADRYKPLGCLDNSAPFVPPSRNPSELDHFRRSLPIYESQEEIVQLIRANRVVLVVGETGSGKTTQIPQLLLDDCSMNIEPCRILCTQPRWLAVLVVAERVAKERGESVGQTVGYHIRLECRHGPMTLLTFCTNEVLLKTLMSGDDCLKNVTHVIVDEVNERDGLTDVLLTKMQSVLQNIPTLKLILSSAALDVDLFSQYFGRCPVIHLKGRQLEVQELFLEDVLKLTGFRKKLGTQRKEKQQTCLTKWCKLVETGCIREKQRSPESVPGFVQDHSPLDREDATVTKPRQKDCEQLEPALVKQMDSCLFNIFYSQDQDSFSQLYNLILSENVNVDYRHSELGATALMMASSRGFMKQMEQLLIMGADINVKASNGWTALDFAQQFEHTDAVDLLKCSIPLREESTLESTGEQCVSAELSTEEQELLRLYQQSCGDEWLDLDLIMDLLHYICSTTCDGHVLIFLPGHNEIVGLCYRILHDDKRFSSHSERFQIFTPHSEVQTLEHRKVLSASLPGVRNIILSTNDAETSITINDVVFVIDTGLVKEKCFDTVSRLSTLKTVWISKASALQRKRRAGCSRPGTCFHLFSRIRFNNMLNFQVPQLLQMPLQELCLQTKLLTPSCPVADFLSRAPQPPPAHVITDAVRMLEVTGAMDQNEDLTDLGYQLAELTIEPHLGKMVLSAMVLKCLDPILTIACMLAYSDPFVLPVQGSQKRAALISRRHFTSCSVSDHMALLTAFQAWQRACSNGSERSFCKKHFLSHSTMEKIHGIRIQLLAQLRAMGFVQANGSSDIVELNHNSENWAVVKAALVAGMYPNVIHIDQESSLLSSNKKKIHFHPSSVLNQFKEKTSSKSGEALPTEWLICDEIRRGKKVVSVRCCSLVTSITVAIFGGCASFPLEEHAVPSAAGSSLSGRPQDDSDSGSEDVAEVKVDDWLAFQCESEGARMVLKLREMWQNLFTWRTSFPSKPCNQKEQTVLKTLISVLTEEEQRAGLQQPSGIGQRPRTTTPGEWLQASVKTHKYSPQQPTSTGRDKSYEAQLSDHLWASCSVKYNSPSNGT
ncbi:3'-5' RNA helicase YTHDC2 isoform X2 [Paralichthys olivaceus]|uniref:3'-5' RNA helicase YTHDC2 isoform X2 n=1 Tax=Paralichthys olivaceus TaxID=8255 RepID=UPI003752557E